MSSQNASLKNLEICIDVLFQKIQPEVDDLDEEQYEQNKEAYFEKERDDIMVKRFQLDQFKGLLQKKLDRIMIQRVKGEKLATIQKEKSVDNIKKRGQSHETNGRNDSLGSEISN